MFDTGAKISVLSKIILRKIIIEIKIDDSKKVSCANGSELIIMWKVRLEVEYNNNIVIGEFFVANEIYPTVIVGIDILNELKIKLVEITNNNILSLQDKFGRNTPLDCRVSRKVCRCGRGSGRAGRRVCRGRHNRRASQSSVRPQRSRWRSAWS